MGASQFHFTHPLWLLLALMIPCLWGLFFFFYRERSTGGHQLTKFIDSHLLPYLLISGKQKQHKAAAALLLWSVAWLCLTLALAGPRWNFRDIEVLAKNQSLVVVLDLSESMNATDVKPSRLGRAKQKIEDIINLSHGVKMGLIAFAADPHMITPITEDKETIRHLLPSLATDLIYVQGSRLSAALEMGMMMLKAEPDQSKALLVLSDGGFEDSSAIGTSRRLAESGITVYAMGVGTAEGAPLRDHENNIMKKNGVPILSKLDAERLREISLAGNGHYLEAHYGSDAEMMILEELRKRADIEIKEGQIRRLWDEGFYAFVLPLLPIMLWWFRRRQLFVWVIILLMPAISIYGNEYFNNAEQSAKELFDAGEYDEAARTFQDCYRKGVAHYKAGQFAEAEHMFRESSRIEVASHAAYNLGNALALQHKLKEAVAAYEAVLSQWPDHVKAKENLEIIKKMLEDEKQQEQNQQGQQSQQEQQQNNGQGSQDQQNQSNSQQNSKQDKQKENQPSNQQQNGNSEKQEQEQRSEKQQQQDSQQERKPREAQLKEGKGSNEEDRNADFWLDRIENDPKTFLKNKCYIESKKRGTKEGIDPW